MSKARDIADSASIINYLDGLTTGLADSPIFTGTVTASALAVDTDVLLVDDTNNRVGINVASPTYELDIDGNIKVSQGLIFGDSTGYLYEGATDQINFRIGADGPYVTFKDIGSSVAEFGNASGALALKTGASERMRIDASGNVGIGTSSPSQALHIADSSGSSILEIQRTDSNTIGTVGAIQFNANDDHAVSAIVAIADGDNEGSHLAFNTTSAASANSYYTSTTERLRITSSGNVGIGTTSPQDDLHVSGDGSGGAFGRIRITGKSNEAIQNNIYGDTSGNLILQADQGNAVASSSMRVFVDGSERMRIDSSGDITLKGTGASAGDNLTAINFYNTSSSLNLAAITGFRDSGGTNYGGLKFSTTNSGSISERMRIDTSGNVGIGTSSPTSLLSIAGVGGAGSSPTLTATTGTNYIGWRTENTGGSFWTAIDNSVGGSFSTGTAYARVLWSNGAYPMVFSTNSTERLRITSSGNVGISATSPDTKLRIDSNDDNQLKLNRQGVGAFKLFVESGGGFVFEDDSTERLRIEADGDIDLGDASSNNYAWIRPYETTTGNMIISADKFATGTGGSAMMFQCRGGEKMRITSSGNVGIGTTSPSYKLQVDSGATDSSALFNSTSANGSHIRIASSGTVKNYIGNAAGFITSGSADDLGLRAVGKISFATNGATADMTIDTSGNVGIGTSSPQGDRLNVVAADNNNDDDLITLGFAFDTGTQALGSIGTHNADANNGGLKFSTRQSDVLTEAMRLDSSGNVGIGTSSPNGKLDIRLAPTPSSTTVNETADFADKFVIGTNASGNFGDKIPLVFNVGNSTGDHISTAIVGERETSGWTTALSFWTNNQTSGTEGTDAIQEKMRITGAGNVGIGTTSPDEKLEISANTGAAIKITSTDTLLATGEVIGSIKFESNDASGTPPHTSAQIDVIAEDEFGRGAIAFSTGRTADFQEGMRIDSSGNLLVGTTDSFPVGTGDTTSGISLTSTGNIYAQALSANVMALSRRGTDGAITVFRKDGTDVGSIASVSGVDIAIGSGNVGVRFQQSAPVGLRPTTSTGVTQDGTISLGNASARFKDLYLSGGVYVGGTTSANLLDDYEEGTWTPAVHSATTTTYTTQTGYYRKVGDLVFVYGLLDVNSIGDGSTFQISGLPFSAGSECTINVSKLDSCATNFYSIQLRTFGSLLYASSQTALDNTITTNVNFLGDGTLIQFSGCYNDTV